MEVSFFIKALESLFFGTLTGILCNYLIEVANSIPLHWVPICEKCSTPIGWKQFFTGKNCKHEGCGAKRQIRYYLLILTTIVFFLGSWGAIEVPYLSRFTFIALTMYFTMAILLDILYQKTQLWFVIIGVPLAITIGVHFNTSIGQVFLGGIIGMLTAGAWHQISKWRYASKLAQGKPAKKPTIDTVSLAAVMGMMVGFPRIIFDLSVVLYIVGITGILVMGLRIATPRLKDYRLLPMASILILGTLLTFALLD